MPIQMDEPLSGANNVPTINIDGGLLGISGNIDKIETKRGFHWRFSPDLIE
jgi:hypothetical protein